MQDMMKKAFESKDGSVLIGVVVIAAITAITAISYATLARNATANEFSAYNDARAYLAAEQGLLMATDWVGVETNWRHVMNSPGTAFPIPLPAASLNNVDPDFNCAASVRYVTGTATQAGYMVVTSRATQKPGTWDGRSLLPYAKELSWEIEGSFNGSSGSYAEFINNQGPSVFSPTSSGAQGRQQRGATFGPTYSKSPIMLSQRSFFTQHQGSGASATSENRGMRFYGSVSIWGEWYNQTGNNDLSYHNSNSRPYFHNFGLSGDHKNYSQGVMVSRGIGTTGNGIPATLTKQNIIDQKRLDDVFRGAFNPFANELRLELDASTVPSGQRRNMATTSNLSDRRLNATIDGITYNTTNPTVMIRFGIDGTRPYYLVSNANGTFPTDNSTNRQYYTESSNHYAPTILVAGTSHTVNNNTGAITVTNPFNLIVAAGSTLAGNVTVVTGGTGTTARDITFNLYGSTENYTNNVVDNTTHIVYAGVQRNQITASLASGASGNPFDSGYDNIAGYRNQGANRYSSAMNEGGIAFQNAAGTGYDSSPDNHVFAFYSAKDINIHLYRPNYTFPTSVEYNKANKVLSAQLFAMNPGGKVRIGTSSSTYEGKGRQGAFAHVVGTMAMDTWWNTKVDHSNTHGGNIRTYHDKRINAKGESPDAPGLRYGEYDRNGNKLLDMRMYSRGWKETNSPL